jgi:hypothetical protein
MSANTNPKTNLQTDAGGTAPPAVVDILKDKINVIRSDLTGEKVGQLRLGDSLISRLRAMDRELDFLQGDVYRDTADWDVLSTYPQILRAYSSLFTAYTDRAFPSTDPIDEQLRYALKYEVGGFYSGVTDLENAIASKSQRMTQRAYARISLAYDHYLKAGDLFIDYDPDGGLDGQKFSVAGNLDELSNKLNYVAPSIEAPGIQDNIVVVKGPDEGREGGVMAALMLICI